MLTVTVQLLIFTLASVVLKVKGYSRLAITPTTTKIRYAMTTTITGANVNAERVLK